MSEDGERATRARGLVTMGMAWGVRCVRELAAPPAIYSLSLASLLVNCSVFLEASDGRDKLFALLGMADDAEESNFQPDYEATTPEVYVKFAAGLLTRDHSSNMILHCAGIGFDRNIESLPSWVPD
ncbi:hypothetical protein DL98DRAFT_588477 [Cadophora sp. DSE1049]|nr:hypothetical protein DL98DRAFT_588477 [Cadophora sp. DSE1049]